jgi:hypothetical protein
MQEYPSNLHSQTFQKAYSRWLGTCGQEGDVTSYARAFGENTPVTSRTGDDLAVLGHLKTASCSGESKERYMYSPDDSGPL